MVRCIRVPKREGEQVRSALFEQGMLDLSARIRSEDGFLLIPVLCDSYKDYEVVDAEMQVQEQRPTDYRDMADVPEELREHLPSSFDVVGDVAMIKLPDELRPYAQHIGEALLRVNRSIRIVFEDHGVKGEFRIRDLERIAGTGTSETVHREFGVRLYTDPARVYFNPRLSSERARIAGLVRDGETVIDMFGGVAPFGTVMCRLARPGVVYSIDLNPDAEYFARMNADRNHVTNLHPMTGDSSVLVHGLPMADRIIMNLPQIADRFLPTALERLNHGGTIHMYKIIEREEFPGFLEGLVDDASSRGHGISIETSELKTYSPTMSVYSLDIHKG